MYPHSSGRNQRERLGGQTAVKLVCPPNFTHLSLFPLRFLIPGGIISRLPAARLASSPPELTRAGDSPHPRGGNLQWERAEAFDVVLLIVGPLAGVGPTEQRDNH